MVDFLNSFLGMEIPVWLYIAAPVVLALIVVYVIWFIQTRVFKRRLRRIIKAQEESEINKAIKDFEQYYPADKLMRYSKRMERYSRQMGTRVIQETKLADKWVQKLSLSVIPPGKTDLRRVLLYCPSSFLFKAFIAAAQHPRLQKAFESWMYNEGEEKVIRLLAETCRGEDFNPAFGQIFLKNHDNLLRELTSEPEWYARYFAYRILLLDKELVSERNLEAGLSDPHPLIRKIVTENIELEREKNWAILWDKLIHDPVFEVRKAARNRIAKDFMDIYSPKDADLNENETVHVLELLDPACQEDRAFAMSSLDSDNKMLHYPSAVFLEKCGVLASILAKTTLDDLAGIDNCVSILEKVLAVNVSGFLKNYPTGDGAPLLAAARIHLEDNAMYGTEETVCYLQKKVYAFCHNKKPESFIVEIYTKTLDAVIKIGTENALRLFAEELVRRENDKAFLKFLLPRVCGKSENLFVSILFSFLENVNFPAREELESKLGSFNPDTILTKVYHILNAERLEYPHIVRISALKILVLLKLPFCLQRILETLPTLTKKEINDFAAMLAVYPQDMFEINAKSLLASPDAQIRACLISIFPTTKNDVFLKDIRASLKDVDPDVRVAAIKALLGFGEIKLLNQETSMLHDPVERVRLTTAEVIARHGNPSALEILRNVILDQNETEIVKIGIVTGLGNAVDAESLKILVGVLDSHDDLRSYAERALANRISKRDITHLIEIFKDAEPQLREKLIPVFKAQGRNAEPQIIEILKDEVSSFKPYLVKILEETGFVDEAKRRLSDRNVEKRREAALLLSLMDTLSAFRGIVFAAKDPDQDVRICVVKALEKLKTPHGREILEKLKEDPDSKIRKYTYWALERLDSLAME